MNIWTTQFKKINKNISHPQYSLTVRVEYIASNGKPKSGKCTVLFPDCLFDMPSRYLHNILSDLLIDKALIDLGAKLLPSDEIE